MELRIHKVCQTASGGSYVVIYEGNIDLVPGDTRIKIEVVETCPANADPEDVKAATDAIRRGAEAVLRHRGEGAVIRLRRLVIHAIDFKAHRFEQFTIDELKRILVELD